MDSFLKRVAADLYRRTGGRLAHTAVVFPNKRAGLFFNTYLAEEAGGPVWAPAYVSISDLFRSLSNRQVGDSLKLVCELYRVFRNVTGSKESLDTFYPWGELLLADFDDADKQLADTATLFGNLRDLHRLAEGPSFLEPEQEAAIRRFFQHYSMERQTALKERFRMLWDALGAVYTGFREVLSAQGLAYEGMLYREAVEHLDPEKLPYERYVFVGFNVLNKVEHTLFAHVQRANKALFYWDYDHFYIDHPQHEAGEFLKRNLRDFPPALPDEGFDTLSRPKEIRYLASPSEDAQARYLPGWIREHLTEDEKETAVVLCNEALLQPVLHVLPAEVRQVNVTMGFPLAQTPVYSFVTAWLDVQLRGYDARTGRYALREVTALLKHPYTRRLAPAAESVEKEWLRNNRFHPLSADWGGDACLADLFRPVSDHSALCERLSSLLEQIARADRESSADADTFGPLYRESLFKAYTAVNRFRTLSEEGVLPVQTDTFCRLLTRVLAGTSIPFHGEPAAGLQVMGVLETRNLDFRHLVLLSVNEGYLPRAGGEASFIPYNLRKAFGMTTVDHRIAVYAYYFYRLLQRAEHVTLLYHTGPEGPGRGEWSRFLLQFLLEWKHPVFRGQLETEQSPQGTSPVEVEKTSEVQRRLRKRFDVRENERSLFSPSALNTYLDCSLKFYFKYVAGLSAPDETGEGMDPALFGTLFHSAAERIYRKLTAHGNLIDKIALEAVLRDERTLSDCVDAAFKESFFHLPVDEKPVYNGTQLIHAAVLMKYLRQLLQRDLTYAPFTFVASEREMTEELVVRTPDGPVRTRIGGIIDRMDCKEGTLRIVDYKTGGKEETPPDVESVFVPGKERPNYVFQTFLYASLMCRREPSLCVAPCLLYIHRAASESYSPVIQWKEKGNKPEPIRDFRPYEAEFRERLQRLLEEVFDPAVPFSQTMTEEKCTYCDFKALCRR